LNGVNFRDYYDTGLSDAQVDQLVASLPDAADIQKAIQFFKDTLVPSQYFDIMEIHNNTGYQGIYGVTSRLKTELNNASPGATKEIWSGDSTSAPRLTYIPNIDQFPPYKTTGQGYLNILGNPSDPQFATVNNWFRGLQSQFTVKRFLSALDAGNTHIMLCCDADWVPATFFPQYGLLNTNDTPRPVIYTIKTMTSLIGTIQSIRRVDFGDPNVFAYEVTNKGGAKVYIMWYDDFIDQEVGQPQASKNINFNVDSNGGSITMTHIVENVGETQPKVEDLTAPANLSAISLNLTESPVFIQKKNNLPSCP